MKELLVEIYKFPLGDCTNGGASQRYSSMFVLDGKLEEAKEYIENRNLPIDRCLYLVRREL